MTENEIGKVVVGTSIAIHIGQGELSETPWK